MEQFSSGSQVKQQSKKYEQAIAIKEVFSNKTNSYKIITNYMFAIIARKLSW